MRVAVIGAGIGGLLCACLLEKKGFSVDVYEKLPYIGGRFTNIKYKGFELSTGALHMIPHGSKGAFADALKRINAKVEIVEPKPEGMFRIGNRNYTINELPEIFSLKDKISLLRILAELKYGRGSEESFEKWLKRRSKNEMFYKIANSFSGWSLSIGIDEISSEEYIKITKNVNKLKGPGIPIGGCGAVVDAISENIDNIFLKKAVTRIIIEDNKAVGIEVDGEKKFYDIIISDIGPKETIKLAGEGNFPRDYVSFIRNAKEAEGIKVQIASKRPFLEFGGVLFTPEARRVAGINEVTNADENLAPRGYHLIQAHAPLKSSDIKKEISIVLKDLRSIIKNFKENCEILLIQVFRKNYPVNRVKQGVCLDFNTPVKNLFIVGDGVKASGYMETEGIAKRVLELVEVLS